VPKVACKKDIGGLIKDIVLSLAVFMPIVLVAIFTRMSEILFPAIFAAKAPMSGKICSEFSGPTCSDA